MTRFSRGNILPHLLPLLVLFLAVVAVYAPSLSHEFLNNMDDNAYVTANEAIRGISLGHLKSAFTTFYVGNYAPVQIISYMIDYTLWGLNPGGFIADSILVHALNGLLLYTIVVRLHGNRLWAFLAASLFLLHPVQVESVAWISERKTLLAMFFFLLAFFCYNEYQQCDAKRPAAWYVGAIVAFIFALLTKSVAVILPVVLLLADYCYGRETRRRYIDKLPFLLAAIAVAALAMYSQKLGLGGGRRGWYGSGPFDTFLTMLPVFCRYLFNLVWPTNLSPFYSPAVKNNVDGEVASAGVLLFLAAILAFYLLRRQRHLSFWFLLFFIGLVPVSQGVPLITLMNDRYLYYPMAGAAVFMAFFPAALLTAPGGKWRIFGSLVVFLILPLSYLSLKQAEIWRDGVAFWSRAYEEAPESDRVRNGFADALFSKGMVLANGGRKDEALSYYLAVLKIDSFDQRTLNNIGELYTKRGELAEGRRYLLRMTKRYPWDLYGFLNLGDNFLGSGEMARAEESYRRAITIEPRSPLPWLGLGYIYRQIGKFDQANEYSRQAELRRNH